MPIVRHGCTLLRASRRALDDKLFISPCFRERSLDKVPRRPHAGTFLIAMSPPGSYTFAVLTGENVRATNLIRFAASPQGTPTFIETLAPRFTSIERRGTSLDACFACGTG